MISQSDARALTRMHCVRLPNTLIDRLQAFCDEHDITQASVVQTALTWYLAENLKCRCGEGTKDAD